MQTQHKAIFIGGPKAGQIMVIEQPLYEIKVPILSRPYKLENFMEDPVVPRKVDMDYFTYVETARLRDPRSIDVVNHYYTAPGLSGDELVQLALMNYASQTATYNQVAEKL